MHRRSHSVFFALAAAALLACATVSAQVKTYTTDADFDSGTLNGLNHDNPNNDQLQISKVVTTLPVMWIANAGEDTVSRWDTSTNKEVARYHTWFGPKGNHSAFAGPAPSRTAVDLDGNCFVANRHFDGRPAVLFKILLDGFVDRNNNNVADTSTDANNDGVIDASEMLPMSDDDFDGVIDDDEIRDERIAWAVRVGGNGGLGRCVAIDGNGDIWVGLFNHLQFWKVDGSTGAILGGPFSTNNRTPYGAAVDRNGILWAATLGRWLLKFDTNTNTFLAEYDLGVFGSNYGIALGRDNVGNTIVYLGSLDGRTHIRFDSATNTFSAPATAPQYQSLGVSTDAAGNIVSGVTAGSAGPGLNQGALVKYRPDGTRIWESAAQVAGDNRGVPVDSDGNVWFVHLGASRLSKFDGATGAHLGTVPSGLSPYTYSDVTGLGLRTSFPKGTWNVVFDSGKPDTTGCKFSWNSLVPQDTTLVVEVRAANTVAGLGSATWVAVTNGGEPAISGQFVEIRVTMQILAGEVSPILYDLSVVCNQPPDCSNAFPSLSQLWPPNHAYVPITIQGVTDPDNDPVTITIDSIWQDESVTGPGGGAGNTAPDATGVGTATANVRAERNGNPKTPGNGRVYHIAFTARDGKGGMCPHTVKVCVPHDKKDACIDDGPLFDSTANN